MRPLFKVENNKLNLRHWHINQKLSMKALIK